MIRRIVLALVLFAAAATTARAETIAGTVVDATTGKSIWFATVKLQLDRGILLAQTDRDGYYHFDSRRHLRATAIVVERFGYYPVLLSAIDAAKKVALRQQILWTWRGGIVPSVPRSPAPIGGSVVSSLNGRPVEGATVELLVDDAIVAVQNSNQLGDFRFPLPEHTGKLAVRAIYLPKQDDGSYAAIAVDAPLTIAVDNRFTIDGNFHSPSLTSAFQSRQVNDNYLVTRANPSLGSFFLR